MEYIVTGTKDDDFCSILTEEWLLADLADIVFLLLGLSCFPFFDLSHDPLLDLFLSFLLHLLHRALFAHGLFCFFFFLEHLSNGLSLKQQLVVLLRSLFDKLILMNGFWELVRWLPLQSHFQVKRVHSC